VSWFLLRHSDGKVRIWHKQHESMNPSCLVSTVRAAGGGIMVWGIFSWHTLGLFVPIEHHPEYCCWTYSSLYDHSVVPCYKAQNISNRFLEHDKEFTILKWPLQSPDLSSIEYLWDVVEQEICIMDVKPTNLQRLHDPIMSIRTKISEECFQYFVESRNPTKN